MSDIPKQNDWSKPAAMLHRFKNIFPALAMAFFLNACATIVNWDYERTPSKAFAQPETTSVGALFQEAADKHPGLSGFSLVEHGLHMLQSTYEDRRDGG